VGIRTDDHARGHQPKREDEPDRDQRAAPGRGKPEHESDHRPEDDRGELVAPSQVELVPLAGDELLQEQRTGQGCGAGEEQRGGEDGEQEVIEFGAVRPLERVEHVDPTHGSGHGAKRHPGRELHVDGALAEVLGAADGLGHGRVGEVGPDRCHGLHAEHEDQQRCHE
jgi:hypothetical protein